MDRKPPRADLIVVPRRKTGPTALPKPVSQKRRGRPTNPAPAKHVHEKDPMPGLACQECGYPGSFILETRRMQDAVRRRRECARCGHRVTTIERVWDKTDGA